MCQQSGEGIGRVLVGICNGNQDPSPDVEDSVGFRDYLFCVGIHISRYSRWRARSSAVPSRGDAVLDCGIRSLWLDDRAGRALTERAPMDVGILTRSPDLRPRLRTVVLGRAAC